MPYLGETHQERNGARAGGGHVFDATAIAHRLAERVLGQPAAVEALRRALVVAQTGLQDSERPLGSFLFVGPTGVGKTELVRRFAAELRSGPDDLCRVDMGQLAQEHYAASFSGAPPGYSGSKEGFTVFARETVEGSPFVPGIVLFDEVEKANPTVLRALLAALDRGVLRLANGQQTISFLNTFVFLTSNLGAAQLARRRRARWRRHAAAAGPVPGIGRLARLPVERARRGDSAVVDAAVRGFFDPEFLNRIDAVVHFTELDPDVAVRVAALEISDVARRLRAREAALDVSAEVAPALVRRGLDPVDGARGIRREVHRTIVAPAAELMVARPAGTAGPTRIRAEVDGDRIAVTLLDGPSGPDPRSPV